jgi:hypothetical protein
VDDARYAPIVSPAAAEEFFATGYNALTCEPDSPSPGRARAASKSAHLGPCIMVDVPAVGMTPSDQLPSLEPALPGRLPAPLDRFVASLCPDDMIVRMTPEDISDMRAWERADRERTRLLAQLLFAARDLAESRIVHAPALAASLAPWCAECWEREVTGVIAHRTTCKTGRVLSVLHELTEANTRAPWPAVLPTDIDDDEDPQPRGSASREGGRL